MSEYFHYVNHTKRLRFSNGDLGGGIRFDAIGRGLASRAFCLLLTRSHDYGPRYRSVGLGGWAGDQVECLGDHGALADEYQDYANFTANAVILLYGIDGPEPLIEVALQDSTFFLQLAHLTNTEQGPALAPHLESSFGKDWRKQAKDLQSRRWGTLHDLVPL